jgi:hypothetical protein
MSLIPALLMSVTNPKPSALLTLVMLDLLTPNRYGIDPVGKLTIGSKICAELLGKLLSDLESMRIESLNTMAQEEPMTLAGGENDDIGR